MSILAFLASLSVYEWSCLLGAWVLLAIVAGVSLGRGMKRADAAEQENRPSYPPPPPPSVRVQSELPPVPAPLPRPQSDAAWLDPWPSGPALIDFDAVHGLLSEPLEQQQVDRMFCEIVAAEGLQ